MSSSSKLRKSSEIKQWEMNLVQSISNKLDFLWIQSANTEVALSKEVQISPENYTYNTITTPPPTPLFQHLNAAIKALPFLWDSFILLCFQCSPWNPGVHWCTVQWSKISEGCSSPLATARGTCDNWPFVTQKGQGKTVLLEGLNQRHPHC